MRIRPRQTGGTSSLSQLSVTTAMPDAAAPVMPTRIVVAQGDGVHSSARMVSAVTAAKAALARTCPTERISSGTPRQPMRNPTE